MIVDDIIDTAGTLTHAAARDHERRRARASRPARRHAVFSGTAVAAHHDSPLQHVIVTNTIPLSDARPAVLARCESRASVARLLGEAIKRIHHGDSISSLVRLVR